MARTKDTVRTLLVDSWAPVLLGGLLLLTNDPKAWGVGFLLSLLGILLQIVAVLISLKRLRAGQASPTTVAPGEQTVEFSRRHAAWRVTGLVFGMIIVGLIGIRVGVALGSLFSDVGFVLGGLGLGLLGATSGALAGYFTFRG